GVFKFSPITVMAADVSPFDTAHFAVTGTGNYKGVSWTTFEHGLLWVGDDKSGETSYSGNSFTVDTLLQDTRIGLKKEDIKYIAWDITAPKDCSSTFYNCSNVVELVLGGTFTGTSSNITTMGFMFYGCKSMKLCVLGNLNTGKVTSMYCMFDNCSSLTSLDVSGFDTGKVTSMSYMFNGCSSLTSLDVSGFDTGKVNSMSHMFNGCSSLTSLDVSSFDTSNVTDMYAMFNKCSSLTSLDLNSFDTCNVTYMSHMFNECSSLTSLDLRSFDTVNVKYMPYMFYKCSNLTSLDLSGFDTGNVIDMSYMFYDTNSLKKLDLSSFDMSKLQAGNNMFSFLKSSSLHYIIAPANYTYKEDHTYMTGRWYKLSDTGSICRDEIFTSLPGTGDHSIEIVRDANHECANVTDGIGVCSICNVSIMFGDNNDDGKINISDAVMLKKYLAGDTTMMINEGAANVNADAKISIEDAVKLMKKLAGMDVELGVAD
ncbi:MAG: BspA family leucine-rich repeat surface protein, partial [Lachnospira sp.]|nr:BspA family leucine-rich repeat surface protein [Lachnospira sp.]